jgi:hypothetical protein
MASVRKIGKMILIENLQSDVRMTERSSSLWTDDLVRCSIYLSKEGHSRLKEIALAERKKVHDLIVEGIDTVSPTAATPSQRGATPGPGRKPWFASIVSLDVILRDCDSIAKY